MVEKIEKTIYKTTDGKEFSFLIQAKDHEARVYLDIALDKILCSIDFKNPEKKRAVSRFIHENKSDLILILAKHSALMPTEEEIKNGV